MEKNLEKLIKPLKQMSLTSEEKTAMKAMLIRNIERETAHESPAIFSWSLRFSQTSLRFVFASVLCVALASGVVTVTANQALPGEFLYPVKIHINEPVAGFLSAKSPIAKAEFETHLVEVRLDEVEKLASKKSLTETQKTELINSVDKQAAKAVGAIAKLQKDASASSSKALVPVRKNNSEENTSSSTVDKQEEGKKEKDKTKARGSDDENSIRTIAPTSTSPTAESASSSPAMPPAENKGKKDKNEKADKARSQERDEDRAPEAKAKLDEVLKKHDKIIKQLRESSDETRDKKDKEKNR